MKFLLALAALLAPAAAFAPANRAFTRRSGITMSHFSTVQTQLKDKDLLVKALRDVDIPVIVAEDTMAVRGYQGETVQAELAIQQDNGQDIGFRFNGQAYEMVADLQFWGQSPNVDLITWSFGLLDEETLFQGSPLGFRFLGRKDPP